MLILPAFTFSRIPEIHFGAGKLAQLPALIRRGGSRVLLVTGSGSFRRSGHFSRLQAAFAEANISFECEAVTGEPSPCLVDEVVSRHRRDTPDWVLAIGGGSTVDAGKAISAMLPQSGSVKDFLEGREVRKHDGRKLPFIAVPTSSGTGSEATKNAVLSEVGENGFKSSLRHDNFMPDIAVIDPELMRSCPPGVTAACGLDALTQLLESWVSSKASPITDALALSGLEHVAVGFLRACEDGENDLEARGHMAYAALLSGLTLANAGLGLVHGFAGPIGGFSPMPHGEVCGTLLAETTRTTLTVLFENPQKNALALEKYARAGAILAGRSAGSVAADCQQLTQLLDGWVERTRIPRLGQYGITAADFPKILERSNGKNSPAELSQQQMAAILAARL